MESLNGLEENRKSSQVSMDLPLEYRVTDAPHAHGGLLVNASDTGLLIQSVKSIPVGAQLNIAVFFPRGFELANLEVLAEIVSKDVYWEENWEGYQYGLKFTHILQEDYLELKQLLVEEPKI